MATLRVAPLGTDVGWSDSMTPPGERGVVEEPCPNATLGDRTTKDGNVGTIKDARKAASVASVSHPGDPALRCRHDHEQ